MQSMVDHRLLCWLVWASVLSGSTLATDFVLPTHKSPSQWQSARNMHTFSLTLLDSEAEAFDLVNCSPAAIEHFPRPFMEPEVRRHGGVIVHIAICLYAFLGLAIVCENYFVASVERLCEELEMTPDMAGATFMAMGSSAPELVATGIGVLLAKDDIGVSGVIGSSVFNMMFVISICALFSKTTSRLSWWPLCRDCMCYAVSTLVLLFIIKDEEIHWNESLSLVLIYVGYCVLMRYNRVLETWTRRVFFFFSGRLDQGQRVVFFNANCSSSSGFSTVRIGASKGDFNNCEYLPIDSSIDAGYYQATEYDENHISLLYMPTQGGWLSKVTWCLCLPIYFSCFATIPDCRSRTLRPYYLLTFLISILWICLYSFIVIWMVTVIGNTLGIPDTVMGLTFVAVGVSVPDALSSLAVLKEGQANMAVSTVLGSNVFDMLMGLGLPWFIQTALIDPGGKVKVYSKGLTYSTMSLVSSVVFLVLTAIINQWAMDRNLGKALMVWYLLFVTIATLTELNVFGFVNPPECATDY